MLEDHIQKWRLILGDKANPEGDISLEGDLKGIDRVLEALYDSTRNSGLGSSSPNVNRWLGDIRKYFPTSVVQLMQKDAIERLQLEQMLLEPELLDAVEPDIHLVGTLLSLNKIMPVKTRESARNVVRKVVEKLERKLTNPLQQAIKGSLSRSVRNLRPKFNEINWHRTIQANLRHYQKEFNAIIPERLIGYGRKGQKLRHIIMLQDQSGSMASSVVHSGVLACIMAGLSSVRTHLVVFDTAVVDLSDQLGDPVDVLFATQLGGGTDINRGLAYAEQLIENPADTILVLISDLYEGGNKLEFLLRAARIKERGVQFIALLALSDQGAPIYDKEMAMQFANLEIPTFACTPNQFPELMAAAIKKESIAVYRQLFNMS
ncbi:MAG: VWA domain-containing protein [Saprospiraceae bacterium]|nr:MAG: VWA domain-containing protein [Saprospiraceae bacterium]